MTVGGDWHDADDLSKGLDRFLGSASGGPGNYYKEVKGTPWFKDGERFARPSGVHSTDLISDFTADFIKSSADDEKPFFLYVSHYAPHWPLQAEESDVEPYRKLYGKTNREKLMQARLDRQIEAGLIPPGTGLHPVALDAKPAAEGNLETERMALHAAMVASIDRSVARILSALKTTNQLDNTLILILSDNGASHQMSFDRKVAPGVRPGSADTFLNQGPSIAALNNTPFRDYKTSYYEGGIASPLIAWWPRGISKPGRIHHSPHHIADIMPTCLDLAGLEYPAGFRERQLAPLVGKSCVPHMAAEAESRDGRILVWSKAIRHGPWKLVIRPRGAPELFDLANDRNETKDLAAEFPDRVAAMRQLHAQAHLTP